MTTPKTELIAKEVLVGKPSTIVDIGYAQLPNPFLIKNGADVYGIDIVEAPAPYKKTFICDLNIDPLPFKDGSVDAVAMGCTLAHVANPLNVLGEVNRVLRRGGVLVVSSPNPNYYWETVLNVFTTTSVRAFLKQSTLSISSNFPATICVR